MKILVLNCGSSSIKYKLFDGSVPVLSGLIERIGEEGSGVKDHSEGIKLMLEQVLASGKIKSLSEIEAVGHRVVHGGELSKPTLLGKKSISKIKKYSELAPLHNPANLKGIEEMRKALPKAMHVAVFDTAFHQTMPEHSFLYALPYEYYKKYRIRRYGFHGISHAFVSERAAKVLKKPLKKLNLITCHLGAGCSMAAVKKGRVVDTSMGFTPLEGLIMGTRSGDIDPGVLIYLGKNKGMGFEEIDELLNKKSGLLGISGVSKDVRIIEEKAEKGDRRCKLSLKMFCYRVAKYLGAYAVVLGKVDGIVFTGGIGENSASVRREVCSYLKILGVKIDERKNKKAVKKERDISAAGSKIKVLVIPTDEEGMIARDVLSLIGG